MKVLTLFIATVGLMVVQTITVRAQSANLTLLSTTIEPVANYAADSQATRTPARSTSNPYANSQTETALDMMGDVGDQQTGKKYTLSVVVRNDDIKTIRAVTFECSVGYSRGRKPPRQITFKSKKEIKPMETVTLSHNFITGDHVASWSSGAVVKRIEYSDGSVWRR